MADFGGLISGALGAGVDFGVALAFLLASSSARLRARIALSFSKPSAVEEDEGSMTEDELDGRFGLDGVEGRCGALSPKLNVLRDCEGGPGIELDGGFSEENVGGNVDPRACEVEEMSVRRWLCTEAWP